MKTKKELKLDRFMKDFLSGAFTVIGLLKKYKIPKSILENTREYKKVSYALSEEDSLEYAINRNLNKVKKNLK